MTTRRELLGRIGGIAVAAPLVALGFSGSAAASECFDPEKLSAGAKSMRKSLGFVTPAPDLAKVCGGCVFFTGAAKGCGTCALLSGGPVTDKSWCRSWAKKA